MHRPWPLVPAVASWLVLAFSPRLEAETITVFAAASTADAVQAVAEAYGAAHGVDVRCSFASSSTLAKQIAQGAPADLFLSADGAWMDHLAARQAIVAASRIDLLGNGLVIITPIDAPLTVTVAKGFDFAATFTGRLAVGDPSHVPVGMHAQVALTALGWWEALRGRLAPAADARAAVRLVELGEVDAGVAYVTDARASAKVAVAAIIAAELHAAIRYPIAMTTTAVPAAAAFLEHLQGAEARAVFTAAGFTMPAPAAAVTDDAGP